MAIKVTNKQIPVHIEYFDFMPRWSLEKAEYEKATIKSIDEKPQSRFNSRDKQTILKMKGDLGEPEDHWPRMPTTEEIIYYQFLDKITDPKSNRFHPARDEDRRPQPKTGACHVITDIVRVKTDEDKTEFLLSKGNIVAHDAAGVEVTHYLPWPERWFKTLFTWESQYSDKTKQFQKICMGPKDVETVYMLPFTKDNAKELFNQRANDNVNFLVKDAKTEDVRRVEMDVNVTKTFELFTNNTFDYLWAGEYIPLPVRQELRQEAVARGYIKGGASDFQASQPATKGGKNAYG